MLASVGQALREARLKKNLSVEEVSRATKIRGARIVDLENDEYMRFPNITYARSFLVLYAKFLGVDITKYPTVEAGSTVGLAEYQYLQSDEAPPAQRPRQEPQEPPEKPRWLILFFVFLAMLALGALVGWYVMNFRRLGSVESIVKKENVVAATPTPTPTATPAPSPEEMAIPVPPPLKLPASPTPEPEVRRAEPVSSGSSDDAVLAAAAATPALAAQAAAVFPPAGAVREIKVRATKRIKVRIVRDNPKSGSLYLGYVNPQQPVLTYRGQYFWIKTTDPEALQVTIDGQPVPGPEAGVEITQSPSL